MSDRTPTPDEALDELVSAVLDGEATDAERARVDADPELRRRLDEVRRVRDLVASPVDALDEMTARRLRDRALAEAVPVARHVAAAPEPRPRGRFDLPLLGAVAALLLLVALAVPLVRSLGGGGGEAGDQLATMSAESSAEDQAESGSAGAGAADAAAVEDESDGDSSAGGGGDDDVRETARRLADLGDADSDAALARRADEATLAPYAAREELDDPTLAGTPARCPAVDGRPVVDAFVGRVDGDDREVQVIAADDGRQVVVLDPTTCDVLFRLD